MRTPLLLALAACGGGSSGPPASVPLLDTPASAAPKPLDGPYASLDEAPTPHGSERSSLFDAGPGGAFEEAQLLVYRDPTGATPPRCAVALRVRGGWYIGSPFACERRDERSQMSIEALGIDLADDGARVRYLERTQIDDPAVTADERLDQRTMVIACTLEGGVPACADARAE